MSREVRLGLVLYGGVSLAIYMNGIANEFFNVVRGRGIYGLIKALTDSDVVVDIVSGASAGGINGLFLAYALCNETEFGAFADLWREQGDVSLLLQDPKKASGDCRSLFDSKGYYQSNLEKAFSTASPQQNRISRKTREKELVSAFREMDIFVAGSDVEGRMFTTFDDLGQTIDVKDHRVIFQLKHRQGRKEPFNPVPLNAPTGSDTDNVTFKSLAKLSRLTSCFPAAFEPVEIASAGKGANLSPEDGRLREWGDLRRDAFFKAGKRKFFVDGGVLNNKPFTSTLDAILYRLASSDVERFLMYVEPDPERFNVPTAAFDEPQFTTTIFDSLVSLPGYQSIASDLLALAEHNTQVERYERLTAQFRAEVSSDRTRARSLHLVDSPSYGLYTRARLAALSERVVQGVLREDGADPLLETPRQKGAASQLLPDFDLLLGCVGATAQQEILNQFDVYFLQRRLFEVVHRIKTLLYPPQVIEPPKDCKEMRELWNDEQQKVRNARTPKTRDDYVRLWLALNRQIDLLQVVQTAAEDMVDQAWVPWPRPTGASGPPEISSADVWEIVESMLQKLLDGDWVWNEVAKRLRASKSSGSHATDSTRELEHQPDYRLTWLGDAGPSDWRNLNRAQLESRWLTQEWLSALNQVLRDRSKKICDALGKVPHTSGAQDFTKALQAVEGGTGKATLLDNVRACTVRILDMLITSTDPVRRAYDHFEALDARLYPMDLAGGLRSKGRIRLVRISPFDARRGFSSKDMNNKVAGLGFHHFAGFFKRSWRSNDIMWGRLDGICQLAECLLTKERLELLLGGPNPDALQTIRARFGLSSNAASIPCNHSLHPDTLFCNNSPQSRETLKVWLEALLATDVDKRQWALNQLSEQEATNPLELLIQMAQYEVIVEALPQVARDAAEEQLEWNCYPVPKELRSELDDKVKRAREANESPLRFDPAKEVFMEGEGYLEPTEVTIAAAAAAVAGIERIAGTKPPAGETPKETPLGSFFAGPDFGIKTADPFKSLPPSVLAAILTQAALVFRSCLLTSLGSRGQAIANNHLFRNVVDLPLRALYIWARWWRRNPASERTWRVLVSFVAIVLLAVGILARRPLIFGDQGLSLPWFIGLIVVPVSVLLVMLFLGTLSRWLLVTLLLATAGLSAGLFVKVHDWLAHPGRHFTPWPWVDVSTCFLVALVIAYALGTRQRGDRPTTALERGQPAD